MVAYCEEPTSWVVGTVVCNMVRTFIHEGDRHHGDKIHHHRYRVDVEVGMNNLIGTFFIYHILLLDSDFLHVELNN